MIKRSNPINKNKQELAKELLKIKDKTIKIRESQLSSLIALKSKLLDLKVSITDGAWNGIKTGFVIVGLINKLQDNGVDSKKLEELQDRSVKEITKIKSESKDKSFGVSMAKSNEQMIDRLLILINSTILNFKKEIKEWPSKKKEHLKTFKLGKK